MAAAPGNSLSLLGLLGLLLSLGRAEWEISVKG
jgi:hypothetical protein